MKDYEKKANFRSTPSINFTSLCALCSLSLLSFTDFSRPRNKQCERFHYNLYHLNYLKEFMKDYNSKLSSVSINFASLCALRFLSLLCFTLMVVVNFQQNLLSLSCYSFCSGLNIIELLERPPG